MVTHIVLISLLTLIVHATPQASSQNISTDYYNLRCAWYDFQSTIKNDILYVQGGTQVLRHDDPNDYNNSVLASRRDLFSLDLTKSWDFQMNTSWTNETQFLQAGAPLPPCLENGALFEGPLRSDYVILAGGLPPSAKTSTLACGEQSSNDVWQYDVVAKKWSTHEEDGVSRVPFSVNSYVEAPDHGLVYWISDQADHQSANLSLESPSKNVTGMAEFNSTSLSVSNMSAKTSPNLTDGQLLLLPLVGQEGALTFLGEASTPAFDSDESSLNTLSPMDKVWLRGIDSRPSSESTANWYQQPTSGVPPEPRADFCAVVVSSSDNSSHNIYMHGGRSADSFYNDVWVLSLPSFRWIKVYEDSKYTYGHRCHLVGQRQMLFVGGIYGYYQGNPTAWQCMDYHKNLLTFDLSTLQWGTQYDADAGVYQVPRAVTAVIGGNVSGGATFTAPVGGFQDEGVATLFRSTKPAVSTSGANRESGQGRLGMLLLVLVVMSSLKLLF